MFEPIRVHIVGAADLAQVAAFFDATVPVATTRQRCVVDSPARAASAAAVRSMSALLAFLRRHPDATVEVLNAESLAPAYMYHVPGKFYNRSRAKFMLGVLSSERGTYIIGTARVSHIVQRFVPSGIGAGDDDDGDREWSAGEPGETQFVLVTPDACVPQRLPPPPPPPPPARPLTDGEAAPQILCESPLPKDMVMGVAVAVHPADRSLSSNLRLRLDGRHTVQVSHA